MDDDHIAAPVPMNNHERIVALQHLGASFHEGHRSICKVATPADDVNDKIPTFLENVDPGGGHHPPSPHRASKKTLQ